MSRDIEVGDLCLILHLDRHPEIIGAICRVHLPETRYRVALSADITESRVGFGVVIDGWAPRVRLPRVRRNPSVICVPREWLLKLKPGRPDEAHHSEEERDHAHCEPA